MPADRLLQIELELHELRKEKIKLRHKLKRIIASYPEITNLVVPIEMPKYEPYVPSWHTPAHKEIRFKPTWLSKNEVTVSDRIEIARMLNDYRFIPANGVHIIAP
jgi:hypothetical protein